LKEIPKHYQKRVFVEVEKEALQTFLTALLRQWRYTIVDEPASSDLILAQEGLAKESDIPVLWFTRSRYQGNDFLTIPMTIEDLWSTVETRFHKPPRNHIRVLSDQPVDAEVRGKWTSLRMLSFSDLGMRLSLCREVVPGEEFTLKFDLNGDDYTLKGEAIYAIPQVETDGTEHCQVGVLFNGITKEMRDDIRSHILYAYLSHVKTQMTAWEFQLALSYFNIPWSVLERLGCL